MFECLCFCLGIGAYDLHFAKNCCWEFAASVLFWQHLPKHGTLSGFGDINNIPPALPSPSCVYLFPVGNANCLAIRAIVLIHINMIVSNGFDLFERIKFRCGCEPFIFENVAAKPP